LTARENFQQLQWFALFVTGGAGAGGRRPAAGFVTRDVAQK